MLDPELERLLADPMRATRKRYLPPAAPTRSKRAPAEPLRSRR
jgi:hypothetical protein